MNADRWAQYRVADVDALTAAHNRLNAEVESLRAERDARAEQYNAMFVALQDAREREQRLQEALREVRPLVMSAQSTARFDAIVRDAIDPCEFGYSGSERDNCGCSVCAALAAAGEETPRD